jgi:FAD-dependent oxidoreductase domain-containing protein 1
MAGKSWDVVIVGGAVTGASAAWWLLGASPGLRVLVVEKDPTYARAATALSVASVRQQFSNPVNVEISRFGVGFIRDFARHIGPEGGVQSLGLRENGYLFLTGTETGRAVLEDIAGMQRGLGAATEVLDRDMLSRRFPWMRFDDVVAGSFGARDEGWFDNMGLLSGFRAAAITRGAVFLRDTVVDIVRDGDRITGVTLAQAGAVSAGQVLCAAGTGSTAVAAMAGIALPVEPRKRTVFVIDAPNARHPEAPLIIDHSGIYIRPEHGQWITATVPASDGPCDPEDWDPDHGQFEELIWERLYNRAEGFDAVKVQRFWVGHYDYNRLDQNAIIGLWPGYENFFIAAGFSGHGLQQAPAVGRGLSEVMLDGRYTTIDLGPLSPARVLTNTPFLERAIV